MIRTKPNVRSAGEGPDVVLLHSSGSSARQWDALVDSLQRRFRLHAVDFHGHGATPAWSGPARMTLADEAALVEPLLHAAEDGVHLVGHSYGGAVALKLAAMHPQRVRSVVVYEPVLFRLLFDYNARHAPAQDVLAAAASIRNRLARGDAHEAARRFVDFWSGQGAWDALPITRRQAVAARMPAVEAHFHALFYDTLDRAQIAQLRMPVLFLTGAKTIGATRRIGELLRFALPYAHHEMLPGMGHLGPVTHTPIVNARIAGFLDAEVALQAALAPLRAAA
jgi:pimeloyl-ACP methyl ester carboxylesterase